MPAHFRKLAVLALVAALAACGGAAGPDEADVSVDGQDVATVADKLVEPGLWRGRRPDAAELRRLKSLGVRTILDLENSDDAIAAERPLVQQLGMTFISQPMSPYWTPSDAQVDQIERILANPQYYPMFVHCQHGQDRTGLIIGLHRVEHEGWSPKAAYKEMMTNGFHKILVFLNHYYEERTGWDD